MLPFLPQYALEISGATNLQLSVLLASYGLLQGVLQLPIAILSDKFGRKIVLQIGLVCFILGSILGYFANNILILIIARSLQGAAAIGSVVFATALDSVRQAVRVKTMAILGAAIGGSVILSIVAASWLHYAVVKNIFLFTAIFATLCLVINSRVLNNVANISQLFSLDNIRVAIRKSSKKILFSTLLLHTTAVLITVMVTRLIKDNTLVLPANSWQRSSLILLVVSVAILRINKFDKLSMQLRLAKISKYVAYLAFNIILALFCLKFIPNFFILGLLLFLYLFIVLEAILPVEFSAKASTTTRGALMGVFSSIQYLGSFIGGSLASCMLYHYDTILWLLAVLLLVAAKLLGSWNERNYV